MPRQNPGGSGESNWVWEGEVHSGCRRRPSARSSSTGTIIAGPGCLFIDNGSERYLIEGTFTHGSEVTVTGLLSGSRIIPEQVEPVVPDAESVLRNVRQFQDELKS